MWHVPAADRLARRPGAATALVLVDIDGTLLHGSPRAHTHALAAAMTEVYGTPVTDDDIRAIRPAGRTDLEIARVVLRGAGIGDERITAGRDDYMRRAVALFPGLDRTLPPPAPAPGAARALARIASAGGRLALLTGNLEPIAHAKMARAGLGRFFPAGQGAFGSDHEDRRALVPIARRRAGIGDGHLAVVVGDTPRDIACARAGGALAIAVATGPSTPLELGAADAVALDLDGVADAFARLIGPGPAAAHLATSRDTEGGPP